jgi:hypothetical protein
VDDRQTQGPLPRRRAEVELEDDRLEPLQQEDAEEHHADAEPGECDQGGQGK